MRYNTRDGEISLEYYWGGTGGSCVESDWDRKRFEHRGTRMQRVTSKRRFFSIRRPVGLLSL